MKFSQGVVLGLSFSCCDVQAFSSKLSTTTATTTSISLLHSSLSEVQERIASLPLPPSRSPGPFRGIRESLSHLSNNQRFVRKRAEELGDVFLSNIYFQPTVVIGGQQAVQDFVSGTELKNKVIHSGFPESFKELHTKWGSLNLDANDVVFRQARDMFASIFSQDALKDYTPIINKEMETYVLKLKDRVQAGEKEIELVPELKELCLQIFSELFSGERLSEEQVQMFNDYNAALLALPFEKAKLEKGRIALDTLKKVMLARYKKFQEGNGNSCIFFKDVSQREGFNDDRVSSGAVLFVWGAYIECASLMINSMTAINSYNPEYTNIIFQEVQTQQSSGKHTPSDLKFWSSLEETLGVLRESLRLIPPGGGTPRYSLEDFEFRGYRIPAGTCVILDPRVGNTDPKLFVEPELFKPSRWVPSPQNINTNSSSSTSKCPFQGTALKLGFGSWFPGGFGAHQCPGIPLAELTSKIFLTKIIQEFDSWTFGQGTNQKGEVKFVEVPIKIPVDDLGVKLSIRR